MHLYGVSKYVLVYLIRKNGGHLRVPAQLLLKRYRGFLDAKPSVNA